MSDMRKLINLFEAVALPSDELNQAVDADPGIEGDEDGERLQEIGRAHV